MPMMIPPTQKKGTVRTIPGIDAFMGVSEENQREPFRNACLIVFAAVLLAQQAIEKEDTSTPTPQGYPSNQPCRG